MFSVTPLNNLFMASMKKLLTISLLFPRNLLSALLNIHRFPFVVTLIDAFLSLYFWWWCGLCPCTVDIDHETTVSFWVPVHCRLGKPALVPTHGCGGNSRWQFLPQVGPLSCSFNLFIPGRGDLIAQYCFSPDLEDRTCHFLKHASKFHWKNQICSSSASPTRKVWIGPTRSKRAASLKDWREWELGDSAFMRSVTVDSWGTGWPRCTRTW